MILKYRYQVNSFSPSCWRTLFISSILFYFVVQSFIAWQIKFCLHNCLVMETIILQLQLRFVFFTVLLENCGENKKSSDILIYTERYFR